jgi:hypothetical protein
MPKKTTRWEGTSSLLVLSGLPEATAEAAASTVEKHHSKWRAVASSFSRHDNAIYACDNAITDLMGRACAFAMATRPTEERPPNPNRIVLAYVAADGSSRVLDAFGCSVWPEPMVHPDWRWPKGKHWRWEIETVNLLVQRLVSQLDDEQVQGIWRRIEARKSDEILLLPGRNFQLVDGRSLHSRFAEFMREELALEGVEEGINVERFAYERLPEFYKRHGGRGKKFAVDARNRVFAKSNVGQDGGHHDLPDDKEIEQALLRRELEGRFRFGTPLQPAGFQHDVQREGALLKDEPFFCVSQGVVLVSSDHANVFPNDVVKW